MQIPARGYGISSSHLYFFVNIGLGRWYSFVYIVVILKDSLNKVNSNVQLTVNSKNS